MIVTPQDDRWNQCFAVASALLTGCGLAVTFWLLSGDALIFFLLLLPAAMAFSALLYWVVRRRVHQRLRLMREPFAQEWERILQSHVVFFNALDGAERERFRQLVKVFLDEVRITGIRTEVDDTCRVLVAASAVIPIFGFPAWEYDTLGEVLIYPSSFGADFRTEGTADENILGLVGGENLRGIMVLSKPDLIAGFTNPSDKRNVGLHEFAHLVDKADGAVDGVPAGIPRKVLGPWLRKVREVLAERVKGSADINPYGYTSEVELFAVATEYFFESPEVMHRKRPELYGLLQQIFRQDMRGKLRSAVKSVLRRRRKISRNTPCPCGSGQKYKKCCLRLNTP